MFTGSFRVPLILGERLPCNRMNLQKRRGKSKGSLFTSSELFQFTDEISLLHFEQTNLIRMNDRHALVQSFQVSLYWASNVSIYFVSHRVVMSVDSSSGLNPPSRSSTCSMAPGVRSLNSRRTSSKIELQLSEWLCQQVAFRSTDCEHSISH